MKSVRIKDADELDLVTGSEYVPISDKSGLPKKTSINDIKDFVNTNKQDIIADLDLIRKGATAGMSALQEVPSEYVTEQELNDKQYTNKEDLSKKQDTLVNGVNIKTINGKSILGSGNIEISSEGGSSSGEVIILTKEEYDSLVRENLIVETFIYFIKEGGSPSELYIGSALIAKKSELENLNFPYTFPIIF